MNFSVTSTSALLDIKGLLDLHKLDNVKVLYTHMKFPVNNSGIVDSDRVIPGSILFDFENVFVDKTSSLPHMLPTQSEFSIHMSALGISNDDVLVVYDNQGLFSAPRVWWMLRCMGHQQVYVLNGGLKAWIEANGATEQLSEANLQKKRRYVASFKSNMVCNKSEILKDLPLNKLTVCDARSAARFNGTEPEPRAGVRSGHIPGACNLHYAKLVNDGYLQDCATLKQVFDGPKAQSHKKWVFTCGSGVTACILALAAHELGINEWAVYDGSWSEWGSDNNLPIDN
ncbi:MAG: sulfurtransferase [Aliiglaciecola sp.]